MLCSFNPTLTRAYAYFPLSHPRWSLSSRTSGMGLLEVVTARCVMAKDTTATRKISSLTLTVSNTSRLKPPYDADAQPTKPISQSHTVVREEPLRRRQPCPYTRPQFALPAFDNVFADGRIMVDSGDEAPRIFNGGSSDGGHSRFDGSRYCPHLNENLSSSRLYNELAFN